MATSPTPRPLRILVRNLLLSAVLAVGLYVVFLKFNATYLASKGINPAEFLALEAGAILLVAYAVARSMTGASTAILERRGVASRSHAVRLFLNLLVAVAATLALFSIAGVSAESIFLGSAFVGIILGLAAQTVLANVFAGLLIVLADPYRPGDHVAFVTSNYGFIAASYPHEESFPGYSGTVRDVGLIYTVIELDEGGLAKFPNGIVLNALTLNEPPGVARAFRVRMTFPQTVSVASVERAVAELPPGALGIPTDRPTARVEVVDISERTWDALVVVWSTAKSEEAIRDRVLRAVLSNLPSAARAG